MVSEDSGRRRFIRRLTTLGAAGGIATLLYGRVTEKPLIQIAQAASGQPVLIDETNAGGGTTELDSSLATSSSGASAFKVVTSATSGFNWGIHGECHSPDGTGVYGYGDAATGNSYGVFGETKAPNGIGVYGLAPAPGGWGTGVFGETGSTAGGAGVLGWAGATTGGAAGVFGITRQPGGGGVQGEARADGGVGVFAGGLHQAPGATLIAAWAASGQTAPLQEWFRNDWTPLAVIDKEGNLGLGTGSPVRQLHIRGNNAVARMDRNVDSASFIFVRTNADYSQVLKSFTFGVKATSVDAGSFFIGDMHTNVSGSSDNRLLIDTSGNVGIGTTTPSSKLHVAGRVKALGYDTGDITYANGVRSTEDGDGIAFYNPQGVKIAVLDAQGNLRVRGKVIEGL